MEPKILPMKVKQVIAELSKLDPEATVVIDLKQTNQKYGRQLPIPYNATMNSCWAINQTYGGCCISLFLPDGAYIAKWKD